MDSHSPNKDRHETNRSVGGLHILPSQNISEEQYSHIRTFIDRAYAVSEKKVEETLFEGEVFTLTYNVSPGTFLSLYGDLIHPLQIGMYYTIKNGSTVSGRISQICSAEELAPILLKDETALADRCKTYLDGWRELSEAYTPSEILLSSWEKQIEIANVPTNKSISLKKNPKSFTEKLRWKSP